LHTLALYRRQLKTLSVAAAIIVISGCSNGNSDSAEGGDLENPAPPNAAAYEIVWSDEFNGNNLNSANWDIQTGDGSSQGTPGWGNNELQYYTADNISLDSGNLVIEARSGDSPDPAFDYTSARIRTQGKLDITYGRVEASIQVPPGVGLWSAFWMLGTDPSVYGGWPTKGEIDIMESFGGDAPFAQAALHYGMGFPQNQLVFKDKQIDPTDGFHQYAVEWDIDQIRFYIDGEHFFTVRKDSYWNYYYDGMMTGFVEGGESAPFDEPQHLILNMAVGGILPGSPNDFTVFPAQMLVDYVRVYECPIDPQNTGLGCTNSIDQTDPFLIAEVPEADVVIASYPLYLDGLQTVFEGTGSDRALDFAVFDNEGALALSEVATADGGMVIDIMTTGGGNVSVQDITGAPFGLFGMGSSELNSGYFGGEISFDIRVISGADTDTAGSLQVKMDSGFPDVGYMEIPLSSLPADQFTRVSLRISEILQSNQGVFGGQAPDIASIINLVTFEPTSAAHLQISNISLTCGALLGCGIAAEASVPLNVFIDEVDSRWGRGIQAYDTVAEDYSDGSAGNHVSWELVDTGEDGHDTVIETTFDNNGASGLTFIGATSGEFIDITSYNAGELVFEVRVLSNPNDHPLVYKVDGAQFEGTGERSLGQAPLNIWTSFAIPVATLQSQGLNLTEVTAFVLMPTFAGQDVVLQWDNVRFEPGLSGGAVEVGLPVDFETEGAFYNFVNFNGGASIQVVNPDIGSGNSSENVVQMQKFADEPFGGTLFNLDIAANFSSSEVMTVKVWSSRTVDVTLKLEEVNVEKVAAHGGSGWETLTFDYTGSTSDGVFGLTFIFDNGTVGNAAEDPDNWTFYYDDIFISGDEPPPPSGGTGADGATGCAQCTDFDDPASTYVFQDFGDPITVMTLLAMDPLDSANTVAMTTKLLGSPSSAGTTLNEGDIVYALTMANSVITVRVYSPDAGIPVRLKLEDSTDPTKSVETEAVVTIADAWETLIFDFTNEAPGTAALNPTYNYDKLSIFFNFGADGAPTDEKTYFWDTIEFENIVAPPPSDGIRFSSDFEAADPLSPEIGDGWTTFVNVLDAAGEFTYGYGAFPSPNGTGFISAVGSGEGGDEQGVQYLTVFSDYNNADHANGFAINPLTFQEFTISSGDSATYRLTFDAKAPTESGVAPPSIASAFIKTLDPMSGFAITSTIEVDLSTIDSGAWATFTIELELDAGVLEGQLLQFGFSNSSTNYDPSAISVDNVDFGPTP
jgi:beta-glucanase (GH16 family)